MLSLNGIVCLHLLQSVDETFLAVTMGVTIIWKHFSSWIYLYTYEKYIYLDAIKPVLAMGTGN